MKPGMKVVLGVLAVGVLLGAVALITMKTRRGEAGRNGVPAFEPAEAVEIVETRELSWQPTADLVGTVFAIRSVAVRNEIEGIVTFVGFDSGQVVEGGQVLLRLDDATDQADLAAAQAAVRVAEANIAQAVAQVALAETELNRLTSLQARAVAEVDIDRARTRLDAARADHGRWIAEADQARARVAQVEARIAKLTIRAPFKARAGLRSVHEGQYLSPGSDVVVLHELTDNIYLDFAVPQDFIERVKVGTTVLATGPLLGPDPVPITVVAADATVNYDTRNLRVRAVVANPHGLLVPGMAVQVRVPVDEPRTVVSVPCTAVRRAAYGDSVFIVVPDDAGQGMRARQKFVTLGQTVGDEVIVLRGLSRGDLVAGAGSFKLRDGMKVMTGAPGDSGASPAVGASERGAS
jgi:membrane fusion protein (multidrug efflux system)